MAYTFDGSSRTITLTTGTTEFSARDLYSRWKDWVQAGDAQWHFALSTVGGDDLGDGLRAGDYYFLQDGWTVVPQDSDHVLTVIGNIYPATPGANMFGSRPGRNVQVQMSRSSLTQTLAVGSGLTEQQAAMLVRLELLTAEMHRLQGLELGTDLVVSAAARVAGAISQSIDETAGVVTVARVA